MSTTTQDLGGGSLSTHIAGGIATLQFGHPQSNSLPGKLLQALAQAIHAAAAEADTKVIVLAAAGEKTFCAGASFDELAGIETAQQGLAFFSGFAAVINAMRTCGKIVIARVQGKCIGGGVGLAAAADYTLAHASASVKLSELAVGIGPFVVGPAVERKIGLSAFSQLTLDATRFQSAAWAHTKGLFAELHPSVELLDQAVQDLAQQLAAAHPAALSDLKRIFWAGTEHWDQLLADRAATSGRLILSDFSKDFIRQFKAKLDQQKNR
jgi:methylglutaconyl-CoA hydratase